MNLTIQIPDEQAAAYRAKATALGLTLEAWVQKLAEAGLTQEHVQSVLDFAARSLATPSPGQ